MLVRANIAAEKRRLNFATEKLACFSLLAPAATPAAPAATPEKSAPGVTPEKPAPATATCVPQ